jgi:ATP-dependent protease ClpP protease subunit
MRDYQWGLEEDSTEKKEKSIFDSIIENASPSTEENNVVEFASNRIYFYSAVTRPKILKLNKAIFNLNSSYKTRAEIYGNSPPPIKIHINSYGGSVFAGLAAVDYIKNSTVPIETIIDGCAASAATLISVVADHRSMHRNSCMLIHQLTGHLWGKFQEMKDDMQNSDMLMKKIKSIYKEHTRIPDHVLEEVLKHDLWWDSETCLKYGLIDEII